MAALSGQSCLRLRPAGQVALALLAIFMLLNLFSNFKTPGNVSSPIPSTTPAPLSTHPTYSQPPPPPPPPSPPPPQPIVGKVSMLYGGHSVYERALATHEEHNRRLNYPSFLLRKPIIDGLFNKLLFLITTITRELEKPEDEQLQWLFWFDSDTVIMNLDMPLETFLPPSNLTDVHFIIAKDWNGPNAGNFFIRVHPWSIDFLSAALALPLLQPGVDLPWHEQTAMVKVLEKREDFAQSVAYCPSRWFNPYRSSKDGEDPPTEGLADDMMIHRGDLQVHFPGYDKWKLAEAMDPWIALSEQHKPEWNVPVESTGYIEETASFWKNFTDAREEDAKNSISNSGDFDYLNSFENPEDFEDLGFE